MAVVVVVVKMNII